MIDPGWIAVGGAVLTWPIAARVLLGNMAELNASLTYHSEDIDEPLIDGRDIAVSVGIGLICAMIWPVTWVVGGLFLLMRAVMRGRFGRVLLPRAERDRLAKVRARDTEQELKELRAKVRDLEIKGGDLL